MLMHDHDDVAPTITLAGDTCTDHDVDQNACCHSPAIFTTSEYPLRSSDLLIL